MTQRRIHQDECPYFVTFNTRGGEPVFEDLRYAKSLADTMRHASQMQGWDVLAYQIMPDHVHLLVHKHRAATEHLFTAGAETRGGKNVVPRARLSAAARSQKPATISDFMYTVKSYFLNILRNEHNLRHSIWHPRFYTKIVDTPEYLETVVEYMRFNPVKDGLDVRFTKSPYQYFAWRKIRKLS